MILDLILFKDPSVKRHVAKTITWRIVGTIDTIIIAWIITGNALSGVKIGGIEVITKMLLYYFHERVWFNINIGLPHRTKANEPNNEQ